MLKLIQYKTTSVQILCRDTSHPTQKLPRQKTRLFLNLGLYVMFVNSTYNFFIQGTTGSPKAVTITHFALVNNGFFVGKRLQIREKVCHKIN